MTKHVAVVGKETDIREAETGVSLELLLDNTTGIKRVLTGGVWGKFLNTADLGSTVLAYEYQYDCIKLLGEGDCVVNETAALFRSAAELSCQKCVLCREGSWQLQTIFRDITEGKAARDDIALIEDICPLISSGALCAFGKNMVSPALSAITGCRDEVNEHIVGKSCTAGKCSGFLSYLIDPALCTSCGECLDTCPEEAIEGEDGFIHMIDEKLCVKCGKCVPACPEGAIKFGGERIKVPKKLTKVGKFH
jgi:NADH-quinone oxidoreductase subunit F